MLILHKDGVLNWYFQILISHLFRHILTGSLGSILACLQVIEYGCSSNAVIHAKVVAIIDLLYLGSAAGSEGLFWWKIFSIYREP